MNLLCHCMPCGNCMVAFALIYTTHVYIYIYVYIYIPPPHKKQKTKKQQKKQEKKTQGKPKKTRNFNKKTRKKNNQKKTRKKKNKEWKDRDVYVPFPAPKNGLRYNTPKNHVREAQCCDSMRRNRRSDSNGQLSRSSNHNSQGSDLRIEPHLTDVWGFAIWDLRYQPDLELQQFLRVTSIGSLPPKALGKSRGPPQNPAEARRTLGETVTEASERPPQGPLRGKFPRRASPRVVPLGWWKEHLVHVYLYVCFFVT